MGGHCRPAEQPPHPPGTWAQGFIRGCQHLIRKACPTASQGDFTGTPSTQTSPTPVADRALRPRLPAAHTPYGSLVTDCLCPLPRHLPQGPHDGVGMPKAGAEARLVKTRRATGGSPRRFLFYVLKSPASRRRGPRLAFCCERRRSPSGRRCAGQWPRPWVLGRRGHRSDFLRKQAAPL